jgi:hypothetical protein
MTITNGAVIEAEIGWFARLLDRRFRIHGGELPDGDVLEVEPPPPLPEADLPYAAAVRSADLGPAERLVLILAALPHLRPQALDPFLVPNSVSARPFTEFGGAPGGPQPGFRPTRETALFLLAGESMDMRLRHMPLFAPDRPLHARRLLDYPAEPGEPGPWTPLLIDPAAIDRLASGLKTPPRFGPDFPAQRIETPYEWDDLVLGEDVREEVEDMVAWVANEDLLMNGWGLARHLKPGYRALFHGPPGTGKTVTAALLGKRIGLPVYRVDLSRVVSKWIGETEKNLAALFDHAADGDMILFFDEADALFGKRGDAKSANDRHANQQIAYLLQRIEESPGLVILASNLKANIDQAFARRFQATVMFEIPDAEARLTLWHNLFRQCGEAAASPIRIDQEVDFESLARAHVLSGGMIINILRFCCLQALRQPRQAITPSMIRMGIRREMANSGIMSVAAERVGPSAS